MGCGDVLQEVLNMFAFMGFEDGDVASLHSIVAAILHLGDVQFAASDNVCITSMITRRHAAFIA